MATTFAQLVSRLSVNIGADAPSIEWTNAGQSSATGVVATRAVASRQGDATVLLWPVLSSPLFVCSEALSRFLGVAEDAQMTRGDVLRAVHAYVQNAALVDSHSQTVRCDRHLKAVFKVDAVELAALAERIDEHLQAAPPVGVTLPLAVPNSAVVQLAVDVAVHDAADELPPLEDSRAAQAEIDALMAQIDACEKRRLFYLDFHQRPLAVLNELVTSMANDRALDEIGTVEPSDDTLAAMFHSAATDDAVRAYLAKHESSRRVFVQRT